MKNGKELQAADVGQRIRELRRRKHLTQAELARRVGIQAGPMNNLEQGRNLPSTPVLAAISRELGVATDALLWGYSRRESAVQSCVREKACNAYGADAPEKLAGMELLHPRDVGNQTTILGYLAELANAYLALEDACGVLKHAELPLHIPFEPTDEGIGQLTSRVRLLLGVGEAVIFDYLELLENAGLRVIFTALPPPLESVGAYDQINSNVVFFIREDLNPERQLFRIFVELGSVYLHVQNQQTARTASPEMDDAHIARKFAALFLMPETAVRRTVRQLGITPDQWTYKLLLRIKHRFGVSAQAFNLRLLELGLITPELQADLRQRIERYYQATSHAEPDASRRQLSPNGRFGDLLLCALAHHDTEEIESLAALLEGLPGIGASEELLV